MFASYVGHKRINCSVHVLFKTRFAKTRHIFSRINGPIELDSLIRLGNCFNCLLLLMHLRSKI